MSEDRHRISQEDAAQLVSRWRKGNPGPIHSVSYDRVAIDRILAQKGCEGIRCIQACNEDGSWTLVLAGVDSDGNDIIPGELAEMGKPCPPFCDQKSRDWIGAV